MLYIIKSLDFFVMLQMPSLSSHFLQLLSLMRLVIILQKNCICITFLPNAVLDKSDGFDGFCLVTNFSNWTDNCHNYILLSNRDQQSPIKTYVFHFMSMLCDPMCNLPTYLAINPTLDMVVQLETYFLNPT